VSAARAYDPAQTERRADTRRWRLQSGRLSGADGRSLPCVIVDISQSGARVRLDGDERLPARVYLVDAHEGVAYKARLVRSAGVEHGLAFTERFSLADSGRLVTEIRLGHR
jgi:hypothetical protein